MNRIDMIFDLLKSLNEKQDEQSTILTRVEADLKYHIKRTDLIEESLKGKMGRPTLKQTATALGMLGTLVSIVVALVTTL